MTGKELTKMVYGRKLKGVAEALGIKPTVLSNYRKGLRKIPEDIASKAEELYGEHSQTTQPMKKEAPLIPGPPTDEDAEAGAPITVGDYREAVDECEKYFQETRTLKATVEAQAKKIEELRNAPVVHDPSVCVPAMEHADLQDAHAAMSEVAINLWDRLASHSHPTHKPFTTWQGKELPPVSPPKKYVIDPEDNIIPASQIPEVYTGA